MWLLIHNIMGKKILNGSLNSANGGAKIQVGTDANQTVHFHVDSVEFASLQLSSSALTTDNNLAGTHVPEDHSTPGTQLVPGASLIDVSSANKRKRSHLLKYRLQSNRLPVIELDTVRCRTVWSTRCLTCLMWLGIHHGSKIQNRGR